MTAVVYSPRSR